MTKTKEQWIVLSGKHSRIEDGETVRYRAGDVIDISDEERAQFPSRFVRLVEFEARVAALARSRAEKKKIFGVASQKPKDKTEGRDPEAVKREKASLDMRRSSERRINL